MYVFEIPIEYSSYICLNGISRMTLQNLVVKML